MSEHVDDALSAEWLRAFASKDRGRIERAEAQMRGEGGALIPTFFTRPRRAFSATFICSLRARFGDSDWLDEQIADVGTPLSFASSVVLEHRINRELGAAKSKGVCEA